LADGSKVWINAGSTLKYENSFGINNRDLILSGEAFFEVERNKDLPFIVKTSEINIVAIGTKFNVKAYSEENTIVTTLIEGAVKLESSTVNLQDNLILKPNEKAIFTKKDQSLELMEQSQKVITPHVASTPKLEILKSIDPAPIISWKDKRWVIKNEKLGQLATKLERRFGMNIIFDEDVLKEFYFGGTLEDENIEQIMNAISYTSPVEYVIQDNTVYIMADKNKMNKFKKLLME
jgi:ferric-dicitrate binding protein FerR (iron transport regulator)